MLYLFSYEEKDKSWFSLYKDEFLLLILQISHEVLTVIWETEICTICKEFSVKSRSNCLKDEESHRVSTDDHYCYLTDAEREDQSEETAVI